MKNIATAAELGERTPNQTLVQQADAVRAAMSDRIEAMRHITDTAQNEGRTVRASEQREFDRHADETNRLEILLFELENSPEGRQVVTEPIHTSHGRVDSDDYDGRAGRASAMRSQALRHADEAHREGLLSDESREKISALVDEGSQEKRSAAAVWASVTGSPAYLSAFCKVGLNPVTGHLEWTAEESAAFRAVASWRRRTDVRAAIGTGGYVLPMTLDPAIIITNNGNINPLRQLARVVTTATSTWRGITSAGATAEWKTEGSQAADGTPSAAEVSIPVFLSDVDIIYSYEVAQDAVEFVPEMAILISDALNNLHATAFTTGNGTTAPQGIVTGLAGTASEINGGGSEVIAAADPVTLQNALPARFSANASWLSHLATRNTLAFFETANGALLYPELRQTPPMLLTKPWYECSNMDGVINAAATENNYVLIYGDVRKGFTIVDHVGATMEFLPGFGANGRPTAQRHAFFTSRHGSEVVVPQALRMLDVPTTA